MTGLSRILVPPCIVLSVLFPFNLAAQIVPGDLAGITVSLGTPSPDLTVRSSKVFEITLTNHSNHPIWVYGDLSHGMEVWLKDQAGKDLPHHTVGALCPPPPRQSNFMSLAPGEDLKVVDDRSLGALGVERAGTYTVKASYYYRVDLKGGEKILRMVQRPIESAPMVVVVR